MAFPTQKVTLEVVEKALFGATPDDPVALTPAPGAGPDPRSVRLPAVRKYLEAPPPVDGLDPRSGRSAALRKYLETQPELLAALYQEVTKAWQDASGQRATFLNAVAEQRARILSLAEISESRPQVSKAAADLELELSRYLVEREGAGADGFVV